MKNNQASLCPYQPQPNQPHSLIVKYQLLIVKCHVKILCSNLGVLYKTLIGGGGDHLTFEGV